MSHEELQWWKQFVPAAEKDSHARLVYESIYPGYKAFRQRVNNPPANLTSEEFQLWLKTTRDDLQRFSDLKLFNTSKFSEHDMSHDTFLRQYKRLNEDAGHNFQRIVREVRANRASSHTKLGRETLCRKVSNSVASRVAR